MCILDDMTVLKLSCVIKILDDIQTSYHTLSDCYSIVQINIQ